MFRLRGIWGLIFCAHPLFGGVVLDGSFGTRGALPGPNYMISANLGKQVGNNLFQSFNQFNLISTESATFTGPSNIQNILSRVTSGSPSSIDGKVSSQIQGANLFFLNPAGVMFGPHARLDVSGSFAVSTADYVKMVGGGRFNANLGGGDVLTSAPVSAFGFLNTAPAAVSITGTPGNFFSSSPALGVGPGKSFSIVGGDINMSGGLIGGEGARVNLVSVKSPGEVQLDATDFNSAVDVAQFTAMGTVNLFEAAIGPVLIGLPGGGPAGPVVIRGGNFYFDNSILGAESVDMQLAGNAQITNHSQIDGGTVAMQLGGSAQITNYSSIFASDTVSVQVGADPFQFGGLQVANYSQIVAGGALGIFANDVQITHFSVLQSLQIGIDAGFVEISDSASLLVDSFGVGAPAGSSGAAVAISADQLFIEGGGRISLRTFGSFDGGNVDIETGSLLIAGAGSGIFVDAEVGSSGKAGGVIVQAGDLKITGGGQISSSTFSVGDAGDVNITADSVSIDGAGITVTTFASGHGGDLMLTVGSLTLANGGGLSARTQGSGNAGNITVQASEATITNGSSVSATTFSSGNAGTITMHIGGQLLITDPFSSRGFTGIDSESLRDDGGQGGNAGSIHITADDLSFVRGGAITTVTTERGGAGGSIEIDVNTMSAEAAFIGADTSGSSGNAGDVLVRAGTLRLSTGAEISSKTFGIGDGGSVTVVSDSLLIDGQRVGSFAPCGIFAAAQPGSTGNAGNIDVHAHNAGIINGGQISSSTFAEGNGGNVGVTAGSLRIDGAGAAEFSTGILAVAGVGSSGIGGSVTIEGASLRLRNHGTVSAASFTSAPAGSVRLGFASPLRTLRVNSGSSISSANTGNGAAGSVLIHTNGPVDVRNGSISTSSAAADAGSIDLFSGDVIRLSGGGSITASAGANGGNIHIKAPSLVYLLDSQVTATAGANGENGAGGNITIDPLFIVLNNSLISANAAAGQGGNINLLSDFFFASNGPITATGTTNNGTINIAAPELDLGAQLITLPTSLISAENQLRERCTALLQGDFSSFISIGRGGTEPEPEELQSEF